MRTNDKVLLQRNIRRRYQKTFLTSFGVYLAAMAVIFGIGLVIKDSFIWYEDGLFYIVLKLLRDFAVYIFLIFCFLGFVAILFRQWKTSSRDVAVLVDTIERMSAYPDEAILLPGNLAEVQGVLQNIQYNALQSRRLSQEAEQRKHDLVVYLAHDLKTPLTSVLGYLTLLRDEQDIPDELRAKYLQIATSKAQRLEDLINEFFEITRFSLKGIELDTTCLNFSRMVEQINDEFQPLFAPKNLHSTLYVQPGIELVADAGKLERVVDNLLRNAVNYSYPGSEITIAVQAENGQICCKVHNYGDTIPAYKLEHVFEQFYRVDAARSGESGGSGLGLAIAKEIIELHGGHIWVQSQDQRIEFTFTLPHANYQ